MQIFAKRFWGFDVEAWPVISFSLDGNRQALIRKSTPGDRLVFVGTETEETDPHQRGRLLGMVEIGRIEVDTAEVVDVSALKPSNFDENGELRWPKGLLILRAWRFVHPPRVTEVLRAQLPFEAAVRAVLLNDVDAAAVMTLPVEEVHVREVAAVARQRRLDDALRAGNPTTGPRPTSWDATIERDASEASFTYAFQFGNREVWKIGHAKDVVGRLAEVNKHVPFEVLNEQWKPALQQRWPTEAAAYDMEQRVLAALRTPNCVGERVSCVRRRLESVWSSALLTDH